MKSRAELFEFKRNTEFPIIFKQLIDSFSAYHWGRKIVTKLCYIFT